MVINARDFHKLESSERKALQNIGRFLDVVRSFRWRKCADLGCGIGYFTLPIAEQWRDTRFVIAIDRSTPMLEELDKRIAHRKLTNVQIRQSVSDRIPLEDNSVDFANMGNVYSELKGRLNYLKEVNRILRPGGTLLLIDWDAEEETDFGPPLNERVPEQQVKQDLEFAGFQKIRKEFLFIGHYLFFAKKPRPR